MKFLHKSLFFCAFVALSSASTTFLNQTLEKSSDTHARSKRFLVFPPAGTLSVMKFVCGYLGPIDIPLWQNINCLRNFQFQYNLPASWATKFPTFPGLSRSEGRSFSDNTIDEEKIKPDSSRKIAYELIEDMLNKENKNGRECMLRTICEVAETPLSHNGLVGELLQIFFTPGQHEKIDDDYNYAMKAGLHRVDCLKLYPDCPFGNGILDTFSVLHNFHLDDILNF